MLRRFAGFVLVMALLVASAFAGDSQSLRNIALVLGLADQDGFVATVETVQRSGRLPAHYVTKRAARDLGWQPGDDLCRSAPGRVIGGDRFGNREGRLPERPGRRWFDADLDFTCGRRGAKRLVFSDDGLIFVTTDHYESFVAVPSEAASR